MKKVAGTISLSSSNIEDLMGGLKVHVRLNEEEHLHIMSRGITETVVKHKMFDVNFVGKIRGKLHYAYDVVPRLLSPIERTLEELKTIYGTE